MNNEIIHFDTDRLLPRARAALIKKCGFKDGNEKHRRMTQMADEVLQKGKSGLRLAAVVSSYDGGVLRADEAVLDGISFKSAAFSRLKNIKKIYVYILTAGEVSVEEGDMMDALYADMWGTAFADAVLDELSAVLAKDAGVERLSSFGPGFYDIDISAVPLFFGLLDGDAIGVEVREKSFCMIPVKSCAGFMIATDDISSLPHMDCMNCAGNRKSCGLCKNNLSDSVGVSRKEGLTKLPDGFVADRLAHESYGIAFDIGTTTVVGILCDLKAGTPITAAARANPQSVYGADVITRIHYSSQSAEHLNAMQQKIIGCMNDIIREVAASNKISKESVSYITVVGNSAMSHLFLGVDASPLARAPYEPVFRSSEPKRAAELRLDVNPEAEVYLLPNIAGHVGSDIVGVMLASGLSALPGASLAIDIGTNGEVVLAKDGEIAACSTAAGPAFEGAAIQHGMRAAAGAIEGVSIVGGQVKLDVIGDAPPAGICGSGLIDAIAQLLDAGLLNYKGRLAGGDFILYDGEKKIVLTQKDIREVQLAKGAIAAGVRILMNHMNITALDRVLIAGAFGSYVKTESALRIGLFKYAPMIKSLGNAAGAGACMALLSQKQREAAESEAARVLHIDLSTHPDFIDEHMTEMYFPKL